MDDGHLYLKNEDWYLSFCSSFSLSLSRCVLSLSFEQSPLAKAEQEERKKERNRMVSKGTRKDACLLISG